LNFKDENFLHNLLTQLTEKFENNPHSPSLVQKLDEDYVNSMMKAITGFEIEIASIEHVFKLSQNRDEKSYENIIGHLQSGDNDSKQVALTMQKNQQNVFK
jgi:transcriptional regulator